MSVIRTRIPGAILRSHDRTESNLNFWNMKG